MRATEWLLLAACAGLLVLGPAMAYQEFAAYEEARQAEAEAAARDRLVDGQRSGGGGSGGTSGGGDARASDAGAGEVSLTEADVSFRHVWRWPLFGLVVVVGLLGSVAAVRVAGRRRWRAVSGRLLGLLLGGMALVEVAFLVDFQWAFEAPLLARALSTVWLYPLGAVLIAGSVYRLTELEPAFGSDAAAAPLLSPTMVAGAADAPDEWLPR